MGVHKVSVSLTAEELEWARARAKAENRSLSSVLSATIRRVRRDEARLEVLRYLGEAASLREEEAEEIRREWRG